MSDTPRTDALRESGEPVSEYANLSAELERENARLRDALSSIKRHVEPQPSALAKAIVATCDSALKSPPTQGGSA